MQSIEVTKDVYWVGVNDRQSDLFEGLWPIKQSGVSLNSFLIKDEKNVIIDLSNEILTDVYIEMLQSLIDLSRIDYIVLNHLEPDHTGALLSLIKAAPNAEILGTAKAAEIAANFYDVQKNFRIVADGETLNIGRRTLKFVAIPFVHWPETMVTYLVEDQILFSCDAFGGYGALPGTVFDDECSNLPFMEAEAQRYYSNIVSAHSVHAKKAIAKLAGLPKKIIAPSHGLIWRENPQRIIDLYSKWSNYPDGNREKAVTILFGSMYGNTRAYAESIMQAVSKQHMPVESFDINNTHISYILPSLWKNQGVIICAPTYETAMFPIMMNVLNMAKIKRVFNRTAAYFGSYGWGSMAKKQFAAYAEEQKWDVIENSQFYGKPKQADYEALPAFATRFTDAVRAAA